MISFFTEKGIVIKSEPIGEYDRRIVLLTKDMGKISAFARNCRRQGNPLMASTDLFVLGEFKIVAGSSYSVSEVKVLNYFEEFRSCLDKSMYGMYFLEVADFLTRENNDEEDILRFLYQSLRAILSEHFDNRLVKNIFELKCMCLSGEFSFEECRELLERYSQSLTYTVRFIVTTDVSKIYTFALKENVLNELTEFVGIYKNRLWNHRFNTEMMLD